MVILSPFKMEKQISRFQNTFLNKLRLQLDTA